MRRGALGQLEYEERRQPGINYGRGPSNPTGEVHPEITAAVIAGLFDGTKLSPFDYDWIVRLVPKNQPALLDKLLHGIPITPTVGEDARGKVSNRGGASGVHQFGDRS